VARERAKNKLARRAEEREVRRQREVSEIHAQMETAKATEEARVEEEAFWSGVTQSQKEAKRNHKALREEASRAAMAEAHMLNVYGIPTMAHQGLEPEALVQSQTHKSLRPAVLRAIMATDTTPMMRSELPHQTEAPWYLERGNIIAQR